MQLLEERIASEGKVIGTDILKVDMFLNHQIDVSLLDAMGQEFFRLFSGQNINKILTVEASGIAIAVETARYFKVPVVFAKKSIHKNVGSCLYSAKCYSFTHGAEYTMNVSRKYLSSTDRVLIIDDFLADGNAAEALLQIASDAGATVVGVGAAIEKGFQKGGSRLRAQGINLQSLAIIDSMSPNGIVFRRQ